MNPMRSSTFAGKSIERIAGILCLSLLLCYHPGGLAGEDTPPRWHLTIAIPGEYKVPAGSISTPVQAVATFADRTAIVNFMEIAYKDDQAGSRNYDCAALLHTAEKIDKDNAYTVRVGAVQIGRETPGYPDVMKFYARYDFDKNEFATSTPGVNSSAIQNRNPLTFQDSQKLYASCWFERSDGHPGPKVSELSIQAHVTCAHMPGAVMQSGSEQNIQWRPSPASEAVAQKLYRAEAASGPFTLLKSFADNTSASYKDSAASQGKTYYYKLVAEAANGVAGADSNVLAVTVLTATTLQCAAAAASYGDRSVNLTASVTAEGKTVDGGNVFFLLRSGDQAIGDVSASTGVTNGKASTRYKIPAGTDIGIYTISARYTGGEKFAGSTDNSKLLTIVPAALTVTPATVTRIYGEPNPILGGEADGLLDSDGIAVTYTTNATQASEPGNYTIVATLADPKKRLKNYKPELKQSRLLVTPAELTVMVASASRAYGAPNPAFTGTLAGLANADKITPAFTCAATPTSRIGAYPIVPSLAGAPESLSHYNIVPVPGTLTVTRAPLSASAYNATRVYGAENPVFSGLLSGVLNGDNILATYETPAVPDSPVGAYPIVPELRDPDGKLSNYEPTRANGTLMVTKAQLAVKPADVARVEGAANPAFTGTITGLQNADPLTARYSTSATQNSPDGAYPITVVLIDPAKRLGNYDVKLSTGTLTVQRKQSALPMFVAILGGVCVLGAGVWWMLRRGKSSKA